ncbi:omega-hydroxypalmitate O-feruloyl transferase [Andrographis paniculata]|uniref:omega-hydroxypalmitate O-feruloyl transferase n=1 Tax=Andrographis paniculata TaxID=175694 RepID=UPI0021E7435B|nr:omega-hydroxypalmitate O-feruloyl transferase [Andrographis paniculata]
MSICKQSTDDDNDDEFSKHQWVRELHFPLLDFPLTIDRIGPVVSDNARRRRHTLYLSNLDDMVGVRVFTPTVYFYHSKSRDEHVAGVIEEALRKVLIPYYPFTGRLRETGNGKLEVFFGPDQGALMVEAHSDVALADLGDLSMPNPAWIKLIYRFPDEEEYKVIDMPLVIAQVTKFACGGFSLGLRMCHCLCDGFGAMQLLSAWAATARAGILVANPPPCWERDIFLPRVPPRIEFRHSEFRRVEEGSTLTRNLWQGSPVMKCYRLSRDYQARLKRRAQAAAAEGGASFTTFDAVAAHVWRSWVKALCVEPPEYELRLTFSVNARPKLKEPPIPAGFYGNVLCVACATSSVERLVNGGLSETARLVQDARLGVSEEYLRSTVDYMEVDRPKRLEFGGKLTITQWTRFSIYESADFGWGKPAYAGPIDLTPTPQVCVFLPEGGGGDGEGSGATVVCICLPEWACFKFRELLMDHW